MLVPPQKSRVNRSLISLKIVVFFVLTGISAIHVVHNTQQKYLGLSLEEYRCPTILAAFISIIGPLVAGPLADRLAARNSNNFGRVLRILTAIFLLLSALVYAFLFFIPPFERVEVARPAVTFGCDNSGAFIVQERCPGTTSCRHNTVHTGALKLTGCTYSCQNSTEYENWVENEPTAPPSTEHSSEFDYGDEISTATESLRARRDVSDEYAENKQLNAKLDEDNSQNVVPPPHLCITGQDAEGHTVVKHCHVYTADTLYVDLDVTMHGSLDFNNETITDWCNYTLDNFRCPVPYIQQKKHNEDCRQMIQCNVMDAYEYKESVLLETKCLNITGDVDGTLTAYMTVRLLGDILPMAVLTLLNTAIVIAVRETSEGRGEVCRQYAWGALGYVLLISPLELFFFDAPETFTVALIICVVCFVLAAIVLLLASGMPLSPPEWWWHTKTGVLVYPMSSVRRYGPEILLLAIVAILFGTFWSSIHSFLYWNYKDAYAATLCSLLLIFLFFFNVDKLIEYCGHSNIFIAGFAIYVIRFSALTMINEGAWLNYLMQILEPAVIGLLWLTIILYMRHVVPRKFTATGQALNVIAFFGIGKGLGALIGMALEDKPAQHEGQVLYEWLAMVACFIAMIYFVAYNLVLAPRCAAKPQHADDLITGSASQQFVRNGGGGVDSGNGATAAGSGGAGSPVGTTNNANGNYSPLRVYHNERGKKGQFRF